MAIVAPNSDEFWPGAVVPLSMVTIEAISGVTIAAAPTPTSAGGGSIGSSSEARVSTVSEAVQPRVDTAAGCPSGPTFSG